MSTDRIVSLVLAAGEGRRFGGRKQLAPLHGRPLLEYALAAAAAAPSKETLLVLGAYADEIVQGVGLWGASVVRCPDWRLGPAESLRAGIAALESEVGAVLVTLGDEPSVAPEASARLIAARGPYLGALRAGYRGQPGHPVLIERRLFAAVTAAPASTKPGSLLQEAGIQTIECGDLGESTDVDTPEHLARLERRRPERLQHRNASGDWLDR